MQNEGSLFRAGDLIWKRRKILSVGLCSLIPDAGLITPQYLRMWLELLSEVRAVFGIKMSNGREGCTCVVHASVHNCYISLLQGRCGELPVWETLCSRLLMGVGFQFCSWQAPLWVALQALDLENDLKSLEECFVLHSLPSLAFVLGRANLSQWLISRPQS